MITMLGTHDVPAIDASPMPESAGSSQAEPMTNPARRGPILLALHGRESSGAAILAASLLSDRLGLDVRVVSVAGPEMRYAAPLDIMPDPKTRLLELEAAHEKLLRERLYQALGKDPSWRIDVRHGERPAREIVRAAETLDATLIVVDAAQHAGIRHTLAGERALEVLRRARCPVLSVASPFSALPKCLVAAVDFSPASIRAVQVALLLADEGATVTLVHLPLPLYLQRPYRDRSGALIGADVPKSFAHIEAEVRPYAPAGVLIQTRVLEGRIVPDVLAEASREQADLIVAGTHGPNRLERFFVGSTAASLLHMAPCSVLIAPPPSAAEWLQLELRMGDSAIANRPEEWAPLLASWTARNRGRALHLEMDVPESGAGADIHGYVMGEITYDAVDGCVEVRVTDGTKEQSSLTHIIGHPESITISATPEGRDRALEIVHGRGHTLLLLEH
jgi:universal stress protein E